MEDVPQPKYLSVIWLLLGLIICIGNIFTSFILWLSKVNREKSDPGRKIHGLWNLICMNLAFSLVGLSLLVNMATLLARNNELSDGLCDFFGFLYTFGFNFAVVGILVGLLDKIYNLLKPFKYHSYVRGESNVPIIIFVCCTLYGMFMAIIPLTRLGSYYQSKYAICLIQWHKEAATRVTVFLNLILFLVTAALIIIYLWLMRKVYENRRQMRVSFTRRKETMVFELVVSSLFVTCWCPYMIAMFVSNISSDKHPEETGIAVLFGVTLVPFLVSPMVTYVLHGHYQEECKKFWDGVHKYLTSKIRKPATTAG